MDNKEAIDFGIEKAIQLIDHAPTVKSEKAKESEIIKAYTKGFDTGVETVKNERPQGELIQSLTELCNDYCKNCPITDVPNECTDCVCTHIRGIIRGKEE